MPFASDLLLGGARKRAVWAAFVFPAAACPTFGALRHSRRLHWRETEARAEAEDWARDMQLGPLAWEALDSSRIAWAGARALILHSMDLPLDPPVGCGRRWAAFLFVEGAGVIVHPVFGVVRGSRRLHATGREARAEAEDWARKINGRRLKWEMIDDTGMVAWVGQRAFVARSILLPHGEPPT
jgi:hypothetical protein